MNLEDMIIVSVDDHVIEPANLFENHLPKKYADRAPRLVYDPQAKLQKWTWEGGVTATPFICAVVTLPPMKPISTQKRWLRRRSPRKSPPASAPPRRNLIRCR